MKRPAFTLLEMMLAAAITVMLLAALYVAVDLQLRHAATARDLTFQSTLARTLLNRMASDLEPGTNVVDPTRFQQSGQGGQGGQGGQSGQSGSGAASGSGGSTGSTTPSATTPSTTTPSTTTGSSTANSTTPSSTAQSSSTTNTGTTATYTTSAANGPVLLMLQGDSTTLTIFTSRVPNDPSNLGNTNNGNNNNNNANMPSGVSDTRRIYYWLLDNGGLARQEIGQVTADAAVLGNVPTDLSDPYSKLLAPEVKSLQFEYFDGTSWLDSWDGTQVGSDGVTPLGPPAAVAITIGLEQPDSSELKMYRHVVAIQTASGATTLQGGSSSSSGQQTDPGNSLQGNSSSGSTP
jgi:hypothetical protein